MKNRRENRDLNVNRFEKYWLYLVMYFTISLLPLPSCSGVAYQSGCTDCDIQEAVNIIKSDANSINQGDIDDFLCTFAESCSVNAEFLSVSNKALYKLLGKEYIELTIQALNKLQSSKYQIILKAVSNPIHDMYDIPDIRSNIMKFSEHKIGQDLLEAINKAELKLK